MSILIGADSPFIVQGITGREARGMVADMLAYGSRLIAGVTPGKGRQEVQGIPGYDTVAQLMAQHRPGISVISVPAAAVLDAALEAFAHGIELCLIMSERIPRLDASRIKSAARQAGCCLLYTSPSPRD